MSLTVAALLPHRPYWMPRSDGFEVTVAGGLPDGTPWQQTIRLVSRSSRFGGGRHFLVCHRCGGRVMALYWSVDFFLVCRACGGLRYFAKNWSDPDRLWPRYDVLASELRHRPGAKPKRYFRYDLRAKLNLARDLTSMLRRMEGRESEVQPALRTRRG